MSDEKQKAGPAFHFATKKKVSVWVSTHPYEDIPDEYFEEQFSRKNTRATNQWSQNYRFSYFRPDDLETNGAETGTVNIKDAAAECSFSSSYMDQLLSKARKKRITDITWLILVFEMEYSSKKSGTESDQYTRFLGAFNYDDGAENYNDIEEQGFTFNKK